MPALRTAAKRDLPSSSVLFKPARAASSAPRRSSNPSGPSNPTDPSISALHPSPPSTSPSDYPTVTPHAARVYAAISQIPAGSVTTYAALSRALGSSPRAVGGALRNNPFAPEVPCHRVIAADGGLGGFKGEWTANAELKLKLLRGEGVEFDAQARILDKRRIWDGFEVGGGS